MFVKIPNLYYFCPIIYFNDMKKTLLSVAVALSCLLTACGGGEPAKTDKTDKTEEKDKATDKEKPEAKPTEKQKEEAKEVDKKAPEKPKVEKVDDDVSEPDAK